MSVLQAALSDTVLEAALSYLESGLSVIPTEGKRTTVQWSRWQIVRPTMGLIHWWDIKGFLKNVAIVCGKVSGNLVIVDLDGREATRDYESTFPELLDTFSVVSGSGNGKHYYYRTREYTPTTRTKGYELRSDGCYVVAPPSVHPDTGNFYRVERHQDIMRLTDIHPVKDWIRAKTSFRQINAVPSMGEIRQAAPYAIKALSKECDSVTSAQKGERNRTLYLAGLHMGNLVQMGLISRSEVENALMTAASNLSGEDGEGASWRTIQNGINNGINSNRRQA